MRNFLKNVLFSVALLAGGVAFAAGPLDGVHQCTGQANGKTATMFMMVMTNQSGSTVWVPINPSASTGAWGYGVGTIAGLAFTGQDESGNAFALTISGASFSGVIITTINGAPVPVTVACSKYW